MSYKDDKNLTEEEEYRYKYNPNSSSSVMSAQQALTDHLGKKPTYTSKWGSQLGDVLGKIEDRSNNKISYDVTGDALYQQYKDKFTQQGKMAMQDAMGQAAAMTGGFGNSYAATVGNQAYQAQLNNLNDVIPELYQMAYDRYNQEGQDLYNQYSLYADRENYDYGLYRDKMSDWLSEKNYLADRYESERAYDYGLYRDEIEDNKWQAEYDLARQAKDDQTTELTDLGYDVSDAEKIADKMEAYKENHDPSGAWNFLALLDSGNAALNAYTFEQYFGYNYAEVVQDTTVPRTGNDRLELMEKRMGH